MRAVDRARAREGGGWNRCVGVSVWGGSGGVALEGRAGGASRGRGAGGLGGRRAEAMER